MSYQEQLSLIQKHITLAQNLPGRKSVDLRKYAHALIIDGMQSCNHETTLFNVHTSHYLHIKILCFFSLSVIRDEYYDREKIPY